YKPRLELDIHFPIDYLEPRGGLLSPDSSGLESGPRMGSSGRCLATILRIHPCPRARALACRQSTRTPGQNHHAIPFRWSIEYRARARIRIDRAHYGYCRPYNQHCPWIRLLVTWHRYNWRGYVNERSCQSQPALDPASLAWAHQYRRRGLQPRPRISAGWWPSAPVNPLGSHRQPQKGNKDSRPHGPGSRLAVHHRRPFDGLRHENPGAGDRYDRRTLARLYRLVLEQCRGFDLPASP